MKLRYTHEEILADHDYAAPHVIGDYRLHGGFDAGGKYISPRTRYRPEAVSNWGEALKGRGGEPLAAGPELLSGPRYPNVEQHKFLLQSGLGETLWGTFTTIGRVEARGAMLGMLPAPSFEGVLLDDVASMTAGHLKPLFEAHGMDEGGIPAKGIGGHDQMWFAARDLAFGEDRYPLPEPPPQNRPGGVDAARQMPQLAPGHSELLRMLMGLLMIEIRAFITFDMIENLLRDPELFMDRRKDAELAADIVARIRIDERVHVEYLRTLFGEIRHTQVHCVDGSELPGREILDPAWERQVHVSTVLLPRQQRPEMRDNLHKRLLSAPDGARIVEGFEARTDPGTFD